jgi:CheY-like chemotaxis protein/HPt (histidine-containing phosphotransfer) domain-containing protein
MSVLLAEDHPINRKLVLRMLDKIGLDVHAVENGAQLLRALDERDFDLVLMDVQMPEVDGVEATRQIRERERGSSRRVPIVALTAHTMKGDRERFLALGMDEYLSKPIRAAELYAMVRRFAPAREAGPDAEPRGPGAGRGASLLDVDDLRKRVDGDEGLVLELLEIFVAEMHTSLAAVEAAVGGDVAALRAAAHSYKGVAANVSARVVANTCAELEHAAAAGALGRIAGLVAELRGATDSTALAIRTFLSVRRE